MTIASTLSAFQRAMLSWDKLHPYNAVHAVRLDGPADTERLWSAIDAVCRAARIGEISIVDRGRSIRHDVAKMISLNLLPPGAAQEPLLETLCAGLNHAFPRSTHRPFLWSVFDEGDAGTHFVVLAYHHVAADAQAIALLLAEVLRRYAGELTPDAPLTLRADPPAGVLELDPALRWSRLLGGIGRTLGVFRRMKLAHKMPDERVGGDRTDCIVQSAPRELHEGLLATCKRREVGLNDALLGAFGAAIAERTPDRHTSRKRRKIALGSVLSRRRHASAEAANYFGVCLGDMLVLIDEPDAGVDAVITQVAAQTKARKAEPGRAGAAAMTTFFVDRVWPLLIIPHSRRSYRKLLPICGGVSTFVVDEERFGTTGGRISRYVRACPTGPATPLLLGPTVFRGRLELSLTYRLTCTDRSGAEALLRRTLELLSEWSAAAGR